MEKMDTMEKIGALIRSNPIIMDSVMDSLSATDTSRLLQALGIRDLDKSMKRHLHFYRDFPDQMDTLTELFENHHRVVFLGEGLKKLIDRIKMPFDKELINTGPICIMAVVIPTVGSKEWLEKRGATFSDMLNANEPVLMNMEYDMFPIKKPNENGVSFFYYYIRGNIGVETLPVPTLVEEEYQFEKDDLPELDADTSTDYTRAFEYIYGRPKNLFDAHFPLMATDMGFTMNSGQSRFGIPYYECIEKDLGITRGWLTTTYEQPEHRLIPRRTTWIPLRLHCADPDLLANAEIRDGKGWHKSPFFDRDRMMYPCWSWNTLGEPGRCYCYYIKRQTFLIPVRTGESKFMILYKPYLDALH